MMKEQQAIEWVEEALANGDGPRVIMSRSTLHLLLDLAKRAVHDPNVEEVKRVAQDLEEAWLAVAEKGDQWRYLARVAINAWQSLPKGGG